MTTCTLQSAKAANAKNPVMTIDITMRTNLADSFLHKSKTQSYLFGQAGLYVFILHSSPRVTTAESIAITVTAVRLIMKMKNEL